MDARFLAGLILGGIVGAGWMAFVVGWRKWRAAIAAVPVARAEMRGHARHVAVLLLVCAAAACTALGR